MTPIPIRHIQTGDLRLAYRELGEGSPLLLLHGWPTSSFLWRNLMPHLAASNRVIALDLPGFGASDKPAGAPYDCKYYGQSLDAFLDALEISQVGLLGHDLGGPVGLYWASKHPERVTRIALLNTIIYPELSWEARAFKVALRLPGINRWITSPSGLPVLMRFGITHPETLDPAFFDELCAPFKSPGSRRALLKIFAGLHPEGMAEIAAWLPTVRVPVRIVYGEGDRILTDIATTVRRLKKDLPHAQVTPLPDCGHFLQEEAPDKIGALLAEFFRDTQT